MTSREVGHQPDRVGSTPLNAHSMEVCDAEGADCVRIRSRPKRFAPWMLKQPTRGAHEPRPLCRGVPCGDSLTEYGFHEFGEHLTIAGDAQRLVLLRGAANLLVRDTPGEVSLVGADESTEEAVVVVGKGVGRRALV